MERRKKRATAAEPERHTVCPDCGLDVAADAIRCPRCHAFLLRGCTGSCASCRVAGCGARKG